jgi:hypothetical protein
MSDPRNPECSAMLCARSTLLVAATLSSFACRSFDPSTEARMRFVHAAADAPEVDFYVGQRREASNVAFGNASRYLDVDAGTWAVQISRAGERQALATIQPSLEPGRNYTVVATGPLASVALASLADDAAPVAGRVRMRLVHAAPSAAALDVYVTAKDADLAGATPSVPSLQRNSASGYLEYAPGLWQVRFTTAGTKTVVLDVGALALEGGQVRTVVALDRPGGGRPLESGVLNDLD